MRIVASCAALVAAGLAFCGVDVARAESAAETDAHVLLFSGFDLWRGGSFANGGLLYSPDGLSRDGFTLKLMLGAGTYRYMSGTTEISGRQYVASFLPGWRFKQDGLEVTVFAGTDVQQHNLSPDDLGNRLRGFNVGMRGGFDLWFEPVPATMMLTASLSASTIGTNLWARAAAGVRTFDLVWLGPEAIACGDENYRQFRFGLHATGLRTDAFEWSLGAGWGTDNDHRSGPYGRIGVLMRR